MKNKLHVLILFFALPVFAQKQDFNWFIGYQGGTSEYGILSMDFNDGNFKLKKDTIFKIDYCDNNVAISNGDGNFLAAFNGLRIYDNSRKIMKNGDSLWYETLPHLTGYSDDDLPQGGLFLPWPEHPDSVLLFYASQGLAYLPSGIDLTCFNIFYSLIDFTKNDGLGTVQERRGMVIDDTIQYGRLTATRHANGRDWWILVNERSSNSYYRILLDPKGIHVLDKQTIGIPIKDGLGLACFSPDGRFYAVKNAISADDGHYIDIYSFDRCTGYLSNHHQFHYFGPAVGGVAFSPNSRYLYASFYYYVYQYDMYSSNIDSTRVLVGEYEPAPGIPASFYVMQLAPDNKIYMCGTSSILFLHVIHNPDEYGLACNFQQKAIPLPTYNGSCVSFSPNFRLGPLDGSDCDTLGLDNLPKAWYRASADSTDTLQYHFTDLSYFEPNTWQWDFGDGTPLGTERHPVHVFDSIGVYNVCLTVSNDYGVDTFCRKYYLGVPPPVSTVAEVDQVFFSVYPNPVSNVLSIRLPNDQNAAYQVQIQSVTGNIWLEKNIQPNINGIEKLDISTLPLGIYFLSVRAKDGKLATVKFIKTDF